jgi:hypothetical protein
MQYAIWKLNFIEGYGFGPEEKIAQLGGNATGGITESSPQGRILGYVYGEIDKAALQEWDFDFVSQEQALEFAKVIDPTSYFLEDGKIGSVFESSGFQIQGEVN